MSRQWFSGSQIGPAASPKIKGTPQNKLIVLEDGLTQKVILATCLGRILRRNEEAMMLMMLGLRASIMSISYTWLVCTKSVERHAIHVTPPAGHHRAADAHDAGRDCGPARGKRLKNTRKHCKYRRKRRATKRSASTLATCSCCFFGPPDLLMMLFWARKTCKPVWQTTESAWGPDAIECQTSKRYKSQLPKARTGKCLILNTPIHVASNPMEGCRSSTSKVKTLDAEAESRNMKPQTANLKPCNCTTAPAKQRAGAGQLRFETQDMVELSEQYLAPLLASHGSTAAQPSCA